MVCPLPPSNARETGPHPWRYTAGAKPQTMPRERHRWSYKGQRHGKWSGGAIRPGIHSRYPHHGTPSADTCALRLAVQTKEGRGEAGCCWLSQDGVLTHLHAAHRETFRGALRHQRDPTWRLQKATNKPSEFRGIRNVWRWLRLSTFRRS